MPRRIFPAVCRTPRTPSLACTLTLKMAVARNNLLQRRPSCSDELLMPPDASPVPCVERRARTHALHAVCRKPRTHSQTEDGSGPGQVLLRKPRTHSRMLLQRLPSWSDELFTPCVESHAPAPSSHCRERALPPRFLVSGNSCPRLGT